MSKLTLLDIAQRTGSDATIGLVEEILTVAPEMLTVPVVTKSGTSYRITRRTGRPRGAFRDANQGVTPGKSTYEQIEVPMFFFDGQMIVDEAIVKADNGSLGSILATEGSGQLQETYVSMGQQFYSGKSADEKGFVGLNDAVDPGMVVDATGTGAETYTAWAVYENSRDGLHLAVGQQGAITVGQWIKQQVKDEDNKSFMAWVNNLSFYIGLALGSRKCVGCIKNITAAKPLSDDMGAQLVAKFPVGRKPTRWFVSPMANYYLQKTRSAVGNVAADSKGGSFAPQPTALANIPIVESDTIGTRAAW